MAESVIFGAVHGLFNKVIVSTSAPQLFVAVTIIVFNPLMRFTGNSSEFDDLV
jgi:hypothetical protein